MDMINAQGNALFLILIAVALFAALSYAVTNSGRGSAGVDREQAEIYASQILQQASALEAAVMRLTITGGCSDTDINFWQVSDGDGSETNGDFYGHSAPLPPAHCYLYR
tara:strand:+ start:2215 stop:2541 length:327 start_codon:yes stop_codon:yes gene_type:complete